MLYKFGTTHENVKRIQEKLNIKQTGYFGNTTRLSVIEFQKANDLEPDGIVGAQTWNKLFPIEVNDKINTFSKDLNLEVLSDHIPRKILDKLSRLHLYVPNPNALHLAHFLAQCAHESLNFTILEENLNYSASGLLRIFPKYFTEATVNHFARDTKAIGNTVYANRNGNGNYDSGDGYNFRGRGLIQLTFKNNYLRLQNWINRDITTDKVNLLENPDLVKEIYFLDSALFFFTDNDIWDIADNGSSASVITAVTKKVNGGVNGLAERIRLFEKFYSLLKNEEL